MQTPILFFIVILVFSSESPSDAVTVEPPSPLGAVWNHISLLMEAVKQKDMEVVAQLFEVEQADFPNLDRFIEVYQGQNIHVDNAILQEDGITISANIKIGEKFPATFTLIKINSMTGLRITGILSEKLGKGCTASEGILGCAVKILE